MTDITSGGCIQEAPSSTETSCLPVLAGAAFVAFAFSSNAILDSVQSNAKPADIAMEEFYDLRGLGEANRNSSISVYISNGDSDRGHVDEMLKLAEKAFPDSRDQTIEELNAIKSYRKRVFAKV